MATLGSRIKNLREKHDIKQVDFAKKIGVSNVVLSRYESDERKPDYEMLQAIADFFEVSTDYLLGRTEIKNLNNDSNNEEFETWMNDPRSKILFKEFNESSEEQKEALLKMWEILKSQGKL
ncbi:helix-turn-helix domain-containing protein [Psychrobacillus sp. FSL K6-1267]|uniref:helix-turn-helix domain-containing protein n=1 Tax=Psychrobacillus sp. FSL K6-1267 TaxID=2921543 RepID=UPI0030F5992F